MSEVTNAVVPAPRVLSQRETTPCWAVYSSFVSLT